MGVLCVLLGLAAAGCLRREETLRVGATVWPGYEPMFLARSHGLYEGKNIQLVSFPSAVDVIRAYRNRAIDVAAVTGDEALYAAAGSPEHRILLVCDFSHGADMILAQPSVESLRDLRGRRVGVEPGAEGAYVLARALETAGLTAGDVTVVTTEQAAMEEGMASAKLDAVVTFEPSASKVLAGGAHRIFDSSQIPGEIMDLLLTRKEIVDTAPRQLQALIDGWFSGLTHLRENPDDAATRLFPRERLDPKAFRAALEGVMLVGRLENQRLLGDGPDNLSYRLKKVRAVMNRERLLPSGPELTLPVEGRFVGRRADVEEKPRIPR